MTMAELGEKVVAIARAEIGVQESPPGSNRQKYGEWYGINGVYWCMQYDQWVYAKAGFPLPFKTASCGDLLDWYTEHHPECLVKDPEPGDIVIYQAHKHTGIVARVNAPMMYVIEGNTSATSDDNGGAVMERTRQIATAMAFIRPALGPSASVKAKYFRQNGMDIVEASASAVSVALVDTRKNAITERNFANAGFFANYKEAGQDFTLPVAHLKALCATENALVKHYASERGNLTDGVVCFDSRFYKAGNEQFYRKALSTLILRNGKATIEDVATIPADADYAISGVPIMRNGKDISWYKYAKPQGWGSDTVRATKHTFVGIKLTPSAKVYIIGWQTTKPNMILYAEAFKRFRDMGFWDVIKLDGGGSYIFTVNGKVKSSVAENRRINSIITWGETEAPGNPYPVPTRTLRKGSKGDDVRWLQYELSKRGYAVGEIDGDFGGKTNAAVRLYQKTAGLVVDGLVGTKTIASLK